MRVSEGHIGRVFMLRFDDGDVLPGCIEQFAFENGIKTGQVVLIGGIGKGNVVVGPRDSLTMPPEPIVLPVDGAHEVVGIGILAPDEDSRPILHIHAALGRSGQTLTGCLRPGVNAWLVAEATIIEFTGIKAVRRPDIKSGFTLLEI